ncbi:hypothetical protein AB1484_18675 [Parafrankia sp. FMc6]|uniref:hypothetical protein n=1 Tax=Parafrankia soli TaxID=2599596 RepID=UPI0034D3AE40
MTALGRVVMKAMNAMGDAAVPPVGEPLAVRSRREAAWFRRAAAVSLMLVAMRRFSRWCFPAGRRSSPFT